MPKATKPPKAVTPPPAVNTPEKQARLGVEHGGKPWPEAIAAAALSPVTTSALVAINATRPRFTNADGSDLGMAAVVSAVKEMADKAAAGDLGDFERMLAAQSVALNASFADLATRANANFAIGNMDAGETFFRLAMRAQSQCRASIETLSEMKNPRPVFINPKQVNHSGGGPQQINNGRNPKRRAGGKKSFSPNKLLGAKPNG